MNSLPNGLSVVCPRCLGFLDQQADALRCLNCQHEYPIRDGIPILAADTHFFYSEISQPLMQELIEECHQSGWDAALARCLRPMPSDVQAALQHYITEERRAGWRQLLGTYRPRTVLDVGCGWGTLGFSFLQEGAVVAGMDLTFERAVVTRLRADKQFADRLLTVVAGDLPHLPFPAATFDLVILNGVLEWVPCSRAGDPTQVQLEFLKECVRVLKPDGELYLAIENRLDYHYFFGNREPHCRLRFVSLLPRRLADWYSRFVSHKPFRTYTYTRRGYQRLLRTVGLTASRFYSAYPDYRDFSDLIDLSLARAVENTLHPRTAWGKAGLAILKRLDLYRDVCPSYSIVASRTKTTSFAQRLLDHVGSQTEPPSLPGTVRVETLHFGNLGSVLLQARRNGTAKIMVRVGFTRGSCQRVRTEIAVLQRLAALAGEDANSLRLSAALLAAGDFEGLPYVARQWIDGVDALAWLQQTEQLPSILDQAARLITTLHKLTLTPTSEQFVFLDATVRPLLDFACETWDTFPRDQAAAVVEFCRRHLANAPVVRVLHHGDYCLQNLLLDPATANLRAVLDWERANLEGLPLLDLLHLLVSTEYDRHPQTLCEATITVLERLASASPERQWVARYLQELRLAPGFAKVCAVLYPFESWSDMHGHVNRAGVSADLGKDIARILQFLDDWNSR